MKAHQIIFLNLLLVSGVVMLFCLAALALGTATATHIIALAASAVITIALLVWANHKGGMK